ncbi:MAG: SMC family ATPase [Leptospira sp.]|nr:SMC family ATPase [Leptospira sp.]
MKILEIRNTGSIAFPKGITWIPGDDEKVAIIGDNGSGKTTLLDTISMAFYGVTPNRRSESGREEGAIYGCFQEKASSIEVKAEIDGKLIHVKRLIDPIAKTQKPYLYVDGKAVTEGKMKEFNEKFLEYTDLPEDLFLSALYHSQRGKGHLVSLDQAGARELLGNLLGFQEYDSEFDLVDSERKLVDQSLAADEVLTKNLRATIAEEDETKENLTKEKEESVRIDKDLSDVEKKITTIQQELADLKSESVGVRDLLEKQTLVKADIGLLEKEITDLSERLKNNLALKEKEPEIKKAVSDKKQVEEKIAELEKSLSNQLTDLESKTKEIEESNKTINLEISRLEDDKTKARKEFDTISLSLSDLRSKLSRLTSELTEAEKKSSLLSRVPCNGVEVSGKKLTESCELLADAVAAQSRIVEIKKDFDQVTIDSNVLVLKSDQINLQLKTIDDSKLKESEKLKNFDSLAEFKTEIEKIRKEIQSEKLKLTQYADIEKQIANLALVDERVKDYQGKIDIANSKKAELTMNLESLVKLISDKQSEVDVLEGVEEDLRIKTEWKKIASSKRDELISKISKLEAKLTQIEEAKSRLESLGTQAKLDRLTRLKNLAEALSPKGVRALKLDAAGPEISQTINDILSECYGTRFQVAIRTTKETGKGVTKEDFSIVVLDEETGEETFVDNKSGGQEAIIKEGISLGVAVFKKQKTGADIRTLIRDEADGGLTSKNAHLYQKMLDKAMIMGGFAQVIFVSHKPEIQELATTVFRVGDGKVVQL